MFGPDRHAAEAEGHPGGDDKAVLDRGAEPREQRADEIGETQRDQHAAEKVTANTAIANIAVLRAGCGPAARSRSVRISDGLIESGSAIAATTGVGLSGLAFVSSGSNSGCPMRSGEHAPA